MTLNVRTGLHEACQQIFPIHPNYANLPIEQGFDWQSLASLPCDELYLVVFRSVRRASADLELLREHDDRAYEEAVSSGGLLRYFKGVADDRRQCLSFCLWESREQARQAAGASSHQTAAALTELMYESYLLERYLLNTEAGPSSGAVILKQL